jgi:hypothetical protein
MKYGLLFSTDIDMYFVDLNRNADNMLEAHVGVSDGSRW